MLTGRPQDLDSLVVITGVGGGCGVGTYKLLFKNLLMAQSMQLQRVASMVRSPVSLIALMQWHMTDQYAPLEAHDRQLATAQEDMVLAPYGGPAACRLVSMYEACRLAVHNSSAHDTSSMLGRLSMQQMYGGNPPCRVAGALVSCLKLWGSRGNGLYKTLEVVEVG